MSGTACATGKKRPKSPRYTICAFDFDEGHPELSLGLCNKTGKEADDFERKLNELDGYILYPPEDHLRLMQELDILRNSRPPRTGD